MDANPTDTTSASGKTDAFRKWESFGFKGRDYVGNRIVLGIAVACTVGYALGIPVVNAVRNAPLSVSYTTRVTSGIQLPRGATHHGQVTMELFLRDATLGDRLLQALPGLLGAVVTITVAWLLFQLLRTTQAGDPFTRPNVRRINTIAVIIGFSGLLLQFAQDIAHNAMSISDRLPGPSDVAGSPHPPFTLLPVVVMIVLLIIGEAFRRGVALREDVEGLV
jgi:uncharacterized membrane protein